VFLGALIDDAGLFPPARLPMAAALSGHRRAAAGARRWLLGRFLCPASRLDELASAPSADLDGLRLGVVLDRASAARDAAAWWAGVEQDVAAAALVEPATGGRARVELAEVRLLDLPGPDAVERDARRLLDGLDAAGLTAVGAYCELPFGPAWRDALPAALAALARLRADVRPTGVAALGGPRLGAKLRCGGLIADAFPSPEQVARFLAAAAAEHVRVKATAGLHRALRHRDPANGFVEHGFLNVVGAAVLAHACGLDEAALCRVLSETAAEAFTLDADGFAWRELRADPAEIVHARGELFVSYGSCSVTEPVEDLLGLGILPLPAGR
jgi:hypothetical protein